jgi:hypothetical protein
VLFIGLSWGVFFYFMAFLASLFFYHFFSPLHKKTLTVIFICCLGHFFGTYIYSLGRSDSSEIFFLGANPVFISVGTLFIENIVWYVREFITGDSLLATNYFFSAFAFLGSVLWYLLFLRLSQLLNIENQKRAFPALVIMCWPSFLLFTSGIGKDSLIFFLVPLVFLSWDQFFYRRKNLGVMLIILTLSIALIAMIRPYLLMIFAGAYYLSTLKGIRKMSFFRLMTIIILIPCVLYITKWVVTTQGGLVDFQLSDVSTRALLQQKRLSSGTSFPILSSNPNVSLLLLPYGFIMNLTMPLFIFARNISGMIASVENAFLVWLLYYFWKQRRIFKMIKLRFAPVGLMFFFFLVGMAFLSLCNTNLGLATRQKTMYLPAFLVVVMLVWLYKKTNKRRLE